VSFSCSRHAVIRVYDEAANVIETHEYKGDFKEWCNTVFGWTATRFPFHTSSAKKVTRPIKTPVITVIGKAFFDVGHSLKIKNQTEEAIFPTMLRGRFIR
jgi:hypothetical protein